MVHLVPRRNACRLYIHLTFTYSVGPSSIVWSERGLALPLPPMRVLEVWRSRALSLVCEVVLNVLNVQHTPPPDHQTKGNPQATKLTNQEVSYLIVLLFPIPSDFHIVPSIKDIPSTPCLVKALEQSFSWEDALLYLFDHLIPCCLGV